MKSPLVIILMLLFPAVSFAQSEQTRDSFLTRSQLNLLVNRKLSQLVTGNNTGTFISNYASFDPVNGSFTLKGGFPVIGDTTEARISFLTFRLSGDLINESYMALFENSKLNTGVGLEGQYHFRTKKSIPYKRHLLTTEAKINTQLRYLDLEFNKKYSDISTTPAKLATDTINMTRLNDLTPFNLSTLRRGVDSINGLINPQVLSGANYLEYAKSVDTLTKMITAIRKAETDSAARRLKIDSIRNILLTPAALMIPGNELAASYLKEKDSILKQITVSALKFDWWTITAAYNRKKFNTYDPSRAFSAQVEQKELNSVRLGLAWNKYYEQSFPKRISFLNIGVQYFKDNNTPRLSTTEVVDVKAIKNSAGDSTRSITRKYDAFTDPIATFEVLQFYSNIYFLRPDRTAGFHLYPSIDYVFKGEGMLNLGLGYLVSFRNQKKDAPVINAEAYFEWNDALNATDGSTNYRNRNEIGIRLTFPFAFFN